MKNLKFGIFLFIISFFAQASYAQCGSISGYTLLGEYNGHGYYLSNISAPWQQAKTLAENAGGYLASMNDQAENDFVKSNLGNQMVFIGYNDEVNEGVGQWANNESVTLDLSYENTAENDYAVMNFWFGTWQMTNGLGHRRFVMEMDCGVSSSCLPGGITFGLQSEVDSFPQNYPGCTTVLGNVSVVYQVTNVDSLLQLRHIDGFLQLDNVTNIEGLQNLTSCKGIHLRTNILEGTLSKLKVLDGSLSISSQVSSVKGLESIEVINGDIASSWGGVSLGKLENLTQLNGSLQLYETSASAYLPNLKYMGGLSVSTSNFSTSGLQNLTHVGEKGIFCHGGASIDLSGLTSLIKIDGILSIGHSAIVSGLQGLEKLTQIEGLSLEYSVTGIEDLDFLNNLDSMNSLYLEHVDIDDISGLESVHGLEKVFIKDCPILSECSIQPVCDLIGDDGDVVIENNGLVVGCNNIQEVEVACSLVTCDSIPGFTKLGEHNGHGYYLSDVSVPWAQAKTLAENTGGYLATMNDQAENDFLKDQLDGNMVFIGYNDETTEGVGQWTDNEPVTLDLSYENTVENDYAIMNFWAGTWQMVSQWVYKPFVVEMECGIPVTCPTDLTLITQEQVDDFASNYPSCTSIEGNLTIGSWGQSEVQNLSGLSQLENIQGTLRVVNSNLLTNLSGMDNIVSIGGNLEIVSCAALPNLTGLEGLTTVGGDLHIASCPIMVTLSGVQNLSGINGELIFNANFVLQDISALTSIDPNTITKLYIKDNTSLTECAISPICEVLAASNVPITIAQNGVGCSSESEIDCFVSPANLVVSELDCSDDFPLPGQPFEMSVTVTNTGGQPSSVTPLWLNQDNDHHGPFPVSFGFFEIPILQPNETVVLTEIFDMTGMFLPGGYLGESDSYYHYFGNLYVTFEGGLFPQHTQEYDFYCKKFDGDLKLEISTNDILYHIGAFGQAGITYDVTVTNNGPETAYNMLAKITGSNSFGDVSTPYFTVEPSTEKVLYQTDGGLWYISSLSVGESKIITVDYTFATPGTNLPDELILDLSVTSGHNINTNLNNSDSMVFYLDNGSGGSCDTIQGFTKLGEHDGHGYYLSDASVPWVQAKTLAENAGGYLATMNNQAENDFLKDQLDGNMVFIGYNDETTEGVGQWADNEPVTLDLSYENTIENDYAVMNFWAGTWQMVSQWVYKPFVVEMECGIPVTCPTDLTLITQEQVDDFASNYPNCTSIEGNLTIGSWGQSEVQNLNGLSQLESIQGNLIFENSNLLVSLSGLNNIVSIGGDLKIVSCNALNNCNGLENLVSIGGDLHISSDAQMTSLSGLQNVEEINGELFLFADFSLQDISALSSIHSNTIQKLVIKHNTSLVECAIAPICEVLAAAGINISIEQNGDGCSSPSEIDCTPSTACSNIIGFTKLGEYNGHGYYLSDASANWAQAKTLSENAGGYLATMNSQAENDFLMSNLNNIMVFIGYNDETTEGVGQWANNEPVTLDLSNGNSDEHDYAVMNFWDGHWGMVNQWVAKRFVMELNCTSPQPAPALQNITIVKGTNIHDIYPNPASNHITFQVVLKEEKEATFNIYDGRGQLLLSEKRFLPQGPSEVEFDVSELPVGMYFVKEAGAKEYQSFVIMR